MTNPSAQRITRTVDGTPIIWADAAGTVHLCEAAQVHPGVRLVWTLCGMDVPAGEAFAGDDPAGCPICREVAAGGGKAMARSMTGPDWIRAAFDDFSCAVDDAFAGPAPHVAEAWHAVLQQVEDFLAMAPVAPGLQAKLVEIAPDDPQVDRCAIRLELHSRHLPDVVLHLTTEHDDAMPRQAWWTRMRRGVGLLEKDWDEVAPADAVMQFVDRHNQRAAADHGEGV